MDQPINSDLEVDIDFNEIYQAYKVMADASKNNFAEFIKKNPTWIIVPLNLPPFQERFLPQDLANLYTLLCIWLKENCLKDWQVYLGCILFESREDANNYFQIWCVTKGIA